MKKNNFVLLMLIVICSSLAAQSRWQLIEGTRANDYGNSVIRTSDGGYAVAGSASSFGAGGSDICIVKLDASGSLQWTKAIGGTGNETARSIIQTADGNYAVTGYGNSFGAGGYDFYVLMLDPNGNLLWIRTIGGAANEVAYSIIQTPDGGLAAGGYSTTFGAGSYDIFLVKLDVVGEYQWSKTIGGEGGDIGTSFINTSDGGFAASGYSGSFTGGNIDYCILKMDASGTPQWFRTIGGSSHDYAWSIIQSTDQGYVVTGYNQNFGAGMADVYVVKFSSSGSLQWTRTIGTTGSDMGASIIQSSDGGYTIAGTTNGSGSGSADLYLVKLNLSGTFQWSKSVDERRWDNSHSLVQSSDGGYLIAGQTTDSFSFGYDDMYIVKFNSQGNTCGNTRTMKSKSGSGGTLGSPTPLEYLQNPVITTPAATVNSGGTVTMLCSQGSPFSMKDPENTDLPNVFKLEQNYPNPFNPNTNIKYQISNNSFVTIRIFDALGKEVQTLVNEQLNAGTYEVEWDASNYPSGIYFYKLITSNYSETKRMVLIK